jgi:hypothetical protein
VTAEDDSNDRGRHNITTDSRTGVTAAQRHPATCQDGTDGIFVLMVQVRILAAEQQVTVIDARPDEP